MRDLDEAGRQPMAPTLGPELEQIQRAGRGLVLGAQELVLVGPGVVAVFLGKRLRGELGRLPARVLMRMRMGVRVPVKRLPRRMAVAVSVALCGARMVGPRVGLRRLCLVPRGAEMPVVRRRRWGGSAVGQLQVCGHGEPGTERCQPQQQSRRDRDAPPGAGSSRNHRPILAGGSGGVKPVRLGHSSRLVHRAGWGHLVGPGRKGRVENELALEWVGRLMPSASSRLSGSTEPCPK